MAAPHPRLRFAVGVCLWLALAGAQWARADALDGQFEVRSAFINDNSGVFLLHADVQYPANEAMRAALADGVTLAFYVQVVVSRARRFWLDKDVIDLTLHRQLEYHAVSGRYIVLEQERDEQQSFATLEAALAALGKVEAWPVLTAPQLVEDGDYSVAVRASMRRGKLNDALRAILFWTDDWQRNSAWFQWSLLR